MFEYTALVDAPVKLFTGIFTGSDAEDEALVMSVVTPPAAIARSNRAARVTVAAIVAARDDAAGLVQAAEPVATDVDPVPEHAVSRPVPRPAAPVATSASTPRTFTPPEPTSKPSIVPALIGIAAAGVTAFWWMRRDSHDRGR